MDKHQELHPLCVEAALGSRRNAPTKRRPPASGSLLQVRKSWQESFRDFSSG
jgi:hypothetical protein